MKLKRLNDCPPCGERRSLPEDLRDQAPISSRRVADRLDIMAVRIEHKGAVVIRMILRPHAGRAIVLGAGGNRSAIEFVDCSSVLSGDSDMHGVVEAALATDPEVRFAIDAEARRRTIAFVLPHLHDE